MKVHVRFNFEPLRDFTSKREVRAFLKKFFDENKPVVASRSFDKEIERCFDDLIERL